MMNLSEIFANAQGGEAMETMARQFGLSVEQTQAAVNALLPAFSAGLQQQSQSMDGMAGLINMFGGGQHAAAFDNPQMAMGRDMMAAGQDFMQEIFGGSQAASQQVQQQVVQQAAAMSGIGSSILSKMLPVIASMLLGGLFKGAMNNGLGDLLGKVLQGGLGGGLGGMFGQPADQPQAGNNPMGDLLGSILGNVLGGGQAQNAPQADPMSAGIDILKGMFKTGQDIQDATTQNMENIFDQVLKANKR